MSIADARWNAAGERDSASALCNATSPAESTVLMGDESDMSLRYGRRSLGMFSVIAPQLFRDQVPRIDIHQRNFMDNPHAADAVHRFLDEIQ